MSAAELPTASMMGEMEASTPRASRPCNPRLSGDPERVCFGAPPGAVTSPEGASTTGGAGGKIGTCQTTL